MIPKRILGQAAYIGLGTPTSLTSSAPTAAIIPLTESIAAPLLEAERQDFRQKLAARDAEFALKADELKRQQSEQVKQRLEAE
jgi:hypothetical protein